MPPSANGFDSGRFEPSAEQWNTIYFIIGYTLFIAIFWHIPYLKHILWPFKIFTVALHEFGHAFAGLLTGAKIEAIKLDPNEGGVTKMRGGNPYMTLPAGYIGSMFWGAIMVFAGFNVLASKIVSIAVGLTMIATLWWAKNWLSRLITIFTTALIGLLWWYEDARYLRFYILFLG